MLLGRGAASPVHYSSNLSFCEEILLVDRYSSHQNLQPLMRGFAARGTELPSPWCVEFATHGRVLGTGASFGRIYS
jgi:hypothetical protein